MSSPDAEFIATIPALLDEELPRRRAEAYKLLDWTRRGGGGDAAVLVADGILFFNHLAVALNRAVPTAETRDHCVAQQISRATSIVERARGTLFDFRAQIDERDRWIARHNPQGFESRAAQRVIALSQFASLAAALLDFYNFAAKEIAGCRAIRAALTAPMPVSL